MAKTPPIPKSEKNNFTLKSLKDIKSICIIGLGQMGYSLALDIRENMPKVALSGIVSNQKKVNEIKKRNDYIQTFKNGEVYTIRKTSIKNFFTQFNLIILAIPIESIEDSFYAILQHNRYNKQIFITDVSSIKEEIEKKWQEQQRKCNNPNVEFIGSHPMCGNEKTGHQNAIKNLYRNKTIFICNSSSSKQIENIIQAFWLRLGGIVYPVRSSYHDKIVANTSHTLHILAALIVKNAYKGCGDSQRFLQVACAGGFRDMTRIAKSDYSMWAGISKQNEQNVKNSLQIFIDELKELKENFNDESLIKLFSDAQKIREKFDDEE